MFPPLLVVILNMGAFLEKKKKIRGKIFWYFLNLASLSTFVINVSFPQCFEHSTNNELVSGVSLEHKEQKSHGDKHNIGFI